MILCCIVLKTILSSLLLLILLLSKFSFGRFAISNSTISGLFCLFTSIVSFTEFLSVLGSIDFYICFLFQSTTLDDSLEAILFFEFL